MLFQLGLIILTVMDVKSDSVENTTDSPLDNPSNMDQEDSVIIQFQKFLVSFLRFLLIGLRGILTLLIKVLQFFEKIFISGWKFYIDTGYVSTEATYKMIIVINEIFV